MPGIARWNRAISFQMILARLLEPFARKFSHRCSSATVDWERTSVFGPEKLRVLVFVIQEFLHHGFHLCLLGGRFCFSMS